MKINDKLIATRFPEELVEQLDEVARHEDRTRSQVLRKITRRYVKTYIPKNNDFFGDDFAII